MNILKIVGVVLLGTFLGVALAAKISGQNSGTV